jgi:hypothetical protein
MAGNQHAFASTRTGFVLPICEWRRRSCRGRPRCEAADFSHKVSTARSRTRPRSRRRRRPRRIRRLPRNARLAVGSRIIGLGSLPSVRPRSKPGHSIRRCHHLRTPRWNRCRRNAPHELRQHDQVENPHILFGPEPVGANHDPGIEFAPDSPLEGGGFEPSVPPERKAFSRALNRFRRPSADPSASLAPSGDRGRSVAKSGIP